MTRGHVRGDERCDAPEGGDGAQTKIWPHMQVTVEYWASRRSTQRVERERLILDARVALLQMDAAPATGRISLSCDKARELHEAFGERAAVRTGVPTIDAERV
jgi:hypothetical protein